MCHWIKGFSIFNDYAINQPKDIVESKKKQWYES